MADHLNIPHVPPEEQKTSGRLVNRYLTSGQLHIHLRLAGGLHDQTAAVTAEVVDISVTGLLVAVTAELRVQPGGRVLLGDGTSTATCEVVHAKPSPDRRTQRLGLEVVDMTESFREELNQTVAALRKDKGGLLDAWKRGL